MLVVPAQPRVTSLSPLSLLSSPASLWARCPPSCCCTGACALDPSAWNEPPPRAEAASSLLTGPTVLAWPWLLSSPTAFLRAQPWPFCTQPSLSVSSCGAILGSVGSGGAGVVGDGPGGAGAVGTPHPSRGCWETHVLEDAACQPSASPRKAAPWGQQIPLDVEKGGITGLKPLLLQSFTLTLRHHLDNFLRGKHKAGDTRN